MHDGARRAAVMWLGAIAVVAVVAFAAVQLAPGIASLAFGDDEPSPDCAEPPRYAEWRVTLAGFDESGEDERRAVAAYLLECRPLHGERRSTVRRLLGDGLELEPDEFPYLEYYLGPDGLGIDEETLILEFDRRERRLVGGEVVQG